MACTPTQLGTSPTGFGIPNEELSLKTQSVKAKTTSDAKELRNACGEVAQVSLYNRMTEYEISGYGILGSTQDDVGLTFTLANAAVVAAGHGIGAIHIMEFETVLSNEDHYLTNVKAKSWDAIT